MEVDMNLLVFLATLVVAVFADSQRPHPTPPSPSYSIKSTPGVENKYYALQEDLMKPAPTIRASRKRQAKIQAEPEGLNLRHGAEDKLPEAVFPQEALGALGAVAQDSEGPKTVTLEHDAASVDHYTNEWVILVPAGEGEAKKVAAVLGHEFLREAHGFQNFFVIRKRNHPEVNSNHSHHITQQLTAHESVETALQQVAKLREKRSVIQDHQPQVVQEVIPVDHLRGLDAAEREQNRRNLASTADGMLRLREVAVRKLVSAVKKSGLPIQPIIEMVKQEAARIGGLNVNEIEQTILRELTRLEEERKEERGHDVRAESAGAVHYESTEGMMASSVNEDDDASVEDEEDGSHTLDRRSPREEEPKVFFKTSPPERQVRSDEDLLLNDEILTVGHGIQLIPVQDSNESAVVLSATEVTIDNFTKLTIDIDKYNERYRDHPFDDGTDEDRLGETQNDNLLSVGNGILLRAIKGHTQVDVLTDQIINELNFFKQLVDFREFNYKFKRLNNKYADSDSEDDEDDEDEDETGYETSQNEFDSDAPGYETAAHELDRRSAPEEEDVPLDDAYYKSEIARLITETLQMGSDTSDSSLSGHYSAVYSDKERSKQSQLNEYLLRDSFTIPDSEFLVEVPDENMDSNDKYYTSSEQIANPSYSRSNVPPRPRESNNNEKYSRIPYYNEQNPEVEIEMDRLYDLSRHDEEDRGPTRFNREGVTFNLEKEKSVMEVKNKDPLNEKSLRPAMKFVRKADSQNVQPQFFNGQHSYAKSAEVVQERTKRISRSKITITALNYIIIVFNKVLFPSFRYVQQTFKKYPHVSVNQEIVDIFNTLKILEIFIEDNIDQTDMIKEQLKKLTEYHESTKFRNNIMRTNSNDNTLQYEPSVVGDAEKHLLDRRSLNSENLDKYKKQGLSSMFVFTKGKMGDYMPRFLFKEKINKEKFEQTTFDVNQYNEDFRDKGPIFEGPSAFLKAEEENPDPSDLKDLANDAATEVDEDTTPDEVDSDDDDPVFAPTLISDELNKNNGPTKGVEMTPSSGSKLDLRENKRDFFALMRSNTLKILNSAIKSILNKGPNIGVPEDVKELESEKSNINRSAQSKLTRRSPPSEEHEENNESENDDIKYFLRDNYPTPLSYFGLSNQSPSAEIKENRLDEDDIEIDEIIIKSIKENSSEKDPTGYLNYIHLLSNEYLIPIFKYVQQTTKEYLSEHANMEKANENTDQALERLVLLIQEAIAKDDTIKVRKQLEKSIDNLKNKQQIDSKTDRKDSSLQLQYGRSPIDDNIEHQLDKRSSHGLESDDDDNRLNSIENSLVFTKGKKKRSFLPRILYTKKMDEKKFEENVFNAKLYNELFRHEGPIFDGPSAFLNADAENPDPSDLNDLDDYYDNNNDDSDSGEVNSDDEDSVYVPIIYSDEIQENDFPTEGVEMTPHNTAKGKNQPELTESKVDLSKQISMRTSSPKAWNKAFKAVLRIASSIFVSEDVQEIDSKKTDTDHNSKSNLCRRSPTPELQEGRSGSKNNEDNKDDLRDYYLPSRSYFDHNDQAPLPGTKENIFPLKNRRLDDDDDDTKLNDIIIGTMKGNLRAEKSMEDFNYILLLAKKILFTSFEYVQQASEEYQHFNEEQPNEDNFRKLQILEIFIKEYIVQVDIIENENQIEKINESNDNKRDQINKNINDYSPHFGTLPGDDTAVHQLERRSEKRSKAERAMKENKLQFNENKTLANQVLEVPVPAVYVTPEVDWETFTKSTFDYDQYNELFRHEGPKLDGTSAFVKALRAEEANPDPSDIKDLDDVFGKAEQGKMDKSANDDDNKRKSVLFSDQVKKNSNNTEGVVMTLKGDSKKGKVKWIDEKVDMIRHIAKSAPLKALNKVFHTITKRIIGCLHAPERDDCKEVLATYEASELVRRSPPDDLKVENELDDKGEAPVPQILLKKADSRHSPSSDEEKLMQWFLTSHQPSDHHKTAHNAIPRPGVHQTTAQTNEPSSSPPLSIYHNSRTLSAEVQDGGLLLSELRRQDGEEREKNRRNLERTKSMVMEKTQAAVANLMRKIILSRQPVRPLIDFVEQTGEEIDGVNVVQTKRELLKELEILHTIMVEEKIVTGDNQNYGDLDKEETIYLTKKSRSAQISEQSGISDEIQNGTNETDEQANEEADRHFKPNNAITQFGTLEEKGRLLDQIIHQTDEPTESGEDGFSESGLSRRSPDMKMPTINARPNGKLYDNPKSSSSNSKNPETILKTDIAFMITDTLKIGSDNSFGRSRYLPVFNDENWKDQWYLQDYRVGPELEEKPINDLNVVPVYMAYNLSGLGIRIVVPDDGLEHEHDDLKENYDPSISYDLNGNDFDPRPRLTNPPHNIHGTRCAGVIAMVANNGKCGAGIAFRAKIGGIRMLDGVSTDRVEGETLKFKHYWVDIYSNSWGPKDDGKTLDPLGYLTTHALVDGITESRNGRGALYVFAAGNGKDKGDTCACDGYVSSIFTVAIATCDRFGHVTAYSERCSGIIATAFSAGLNKHHVVTTDVKNSCTQAHTGTSAAAPLVAGILALLLEANPSVTWRDAQHLLIWTSEVAPLADNYGWYVNGFGFLVSQDFGFGMVNAYNLITAAKSWTNVPESNICAVPVEVGDNNVLLSKMASQFEILTDACLGDIAGEINYLEHVQLNVDISYPVRGDLQIVLYSPMGTRSHLLEARPLDRSGHGLVGWTFKTLHAWGENPRGLWTLQVFDVNGDEKAPGQIHKLKLILHGTRDKPAHYANGPRSYDPFELKE